MIDILVRDTVLNLTASALFGKTFQPINNVDYQKVYKECCDQSIEALCYDYVKPYLSDELNNVWRKRYRQRISSNVRLDMDNGEVDRIMNSVLVAYVTMKGSASARYYPEPIYRVMGDIDFLVKYEDLEKAGAALIKNGFVFEDHEPNKCHVSYRKDASIWEMHWEPNGIPNNQKGELIRKYMADMIESAEVYQTEDFSYRIPNTFHHGLILLLHTATHLINTGVGLRHLCDWAVFAGSLSNDVFVNMFEAVLKEAGLWRFAQLLTLVSVKYVGCPEREWAGEADDSVLDNMINDIFDGGNFGIKNEQRINQAKLMTDRDNGNVGKINPVAQLFKSLNFKTRSRYPLTKKLPLLLPLLWIPIIITHLFRIIRGKRPNIEVASVISGAKERQALYTNFELFE